MNTRVPWMLDWLGAVAEKGGGWCRRLGNIETKLLEHDLAGIAVERPVFISGLARAGTTLLLELVAGQPHFAAHAYRDYPFVDFPVFWSRILSAWPGMKGQELRERAHGDGIMVNADSPEAFDEMLWMRFFPRLHDPRAANVVTADAPDGGFADFYRDHIRKILWLRGGRRFVSKNNYNVARMDYLAARFPDAVFVLPVREAASHVASLLRQHRQFSAAQAQDARALNYMRRCGHFEFGLDFRPVNFGEDAATQAILDHAARGDMAMAYVLYWQDTMRFILAQKEKLGGRMVIVPFERLCAAPSASLAALNAAAGLDIDAAALQRHAATIRTPAYYQADIGAAAQSAIEKGCADIYTALLQKSSV